MQFPLALSLAAALASRVSAQTPPNFNVSASTNLPFDFNGMPISAGQNLQYLVSRNEPTVSLPESLPADGLYLLLMVDPDVPSPLAPSDRAEILHWFQPNVQATSPTDLTLTPSVDAIAPYNPPQPPSLEPHRYILLLYSQEQEQFEVPEGFEGFNDEMRTSFDALTFQERAGLGSPVAASYFLTGNNGTSVTFPPSASGSGMPSPTAVQPPIQTGNAASMAVGWSVMMGAAGLVAAAMA